MKCLGIKQDAMLEVEVHVKRREVRWARAQRQRRHFLNRRLVSHSARPLHTPLPSSATLQTNAIMSDATLYEETFNITSTIADKYDRVTRVLGSTHDASTTLALDVNHELYPLSSGETVTMVLATTLNLDGTKDERGWREKKGESTLADMYDYVCYGKVYRFEEGEEGNTM